jgi:hypothetical protein
MDSKPKKSLSDYKWFKMFNEREQKELLFAQMYFNEFGHGTDGHHRLMLIARLLGYLSLAESDPDAFKEFLDTWE